MSVQAGIYHLDGRDEDPQSLDKLSSGLSRQGPDSESWFRDRGIAILYRAFHTTAESRGEQQPYISSSGRVFTWDGRLDNRSQLLSDLRQDVREDLGNVAIVAAAFDRWGCDCLRRILGDWALTVWTRKEQELLFAVDYMSIRHIFYQLRRSQLWWASDPAPLVLLSGEKFEIDEHYVAGYLANDPAPTCTPFCTIRQVPQGCFVRFCKGKEHCEPYWQFNVRSTIRYKRDADYEEHFRDVFRTSVRRRLNTDTPILAELSGGLDSSSIVCMADYILDAGEAVTPRLDTLSYFDKTEPSGDDWRYFPVIEEKRGRPGFHIDTSSLATAPDSLQYPHLSVLPGYFGSRRLLEERRAEVISNGGHRVVLSGIGGDEFLGGVPDPTAQLADLIVRLRLLTLAHQMTAWSLEKRRPWVHLLMQALNELIPPSLTRQFRNQGTVESWINRDFADRTDLSGLQLGIGIPANGGMPTQRSCLSTVYMLASKMAKYLARRGALEEVRYPFLDRDLVEFILAIPANQILRPGERRSLMRRGLRAMVPEQILARRTKQFGVRTPILILNKHRSELLAAFQSPITFQLGFIDARGFLEAVRTAADGKEVPIVRILKMISLEFWLKDLASRGLLASVSVNNASAEVGESLSGAHRRVSGSFC